MKTEQPNLNYLWASLLMEELYRCGVRLVCASPGSRSAPLALAAARHGGLECVMHYDERGSAFYALGHARATGMPAVWITTSGSAATQGLPAVVEAAQHRVPLILITADRPPELRDCEANQSIDQVKLFGSYLRWQFDLPCPDPAFPQASLLSLADHAVARSLRSPAGPVHLNAMFREPLDPAPVGGGVRLDPALSGWAGSNLPRTLASRPLAEPTATDLDRLAETARGARHGLLVVGGLVRPADHEAVRRLARKLKWPVLPDAASGLRLGKAPPFACLHYDLLLDGNAPYPDMVLQIGGHLTSKRLLRFLQEKTPAVFAAVHDHPFRADPTHRITHSLECDIPSFCSALEARLDLDENPDWTAQWVARSATIGEELDRRLTGLSEPALARIVSQLLPDGSGLFLASSMPVRDMDTFGAAAGQRIRVAANRGASGIDGLVATAAGFARGLQKPVTAILGDLALLHDLNSLNYLRSGPPVILVAINNDGGGIFSFLPIANHRADFETVFGTPHGLRFEHAARQFDLAYASPSTLTDFKQAYRDAVAAGRSTLIEVRTRRDENRHLHASLREAVQTRLGTTP